MTNRFFQILIWMGITAVLTVCSMLLWQVCDGDMQSTASLKWLQCVQTVGTFLLPPLICAWLWDSRHRPLARLRLDRVPDKGLLGLGVIITVCAVPGINLLADLNSRMVLPEALADLEALIRSLEESAALLTERFLQADNAGILLINIGLLALLPALAEELSFRGTLQQIIGGEPSDGEIQPKTHLAIWVTAFLFAAVHMQFYGFVPRMLLGAMFGYVFVWSGCLWIPVAMHFVNNGMAVVVYYFMGAEADGKNYADTLGAGTTWWLGVLSLVLTFLGLLIFYRRTHTQ